MVNVDQETATTGAGGGGRSANQPLFPGVYLVDGHRNRNLYHQGREYQQELDRIYRQMKAILDRSADWLRGLDLAPEHLAASLPMR